MFIGRKDELETLRKTISGKRKATVLLYGRRRIGKTSLIREALKDIKDTVIIYHEFHQVTLEQNLNEFSSSIAKAFSIPSFSSFKTLSDAFSFISEMKRETIVVMDEYSDMKIKADKGVVDSYMRTAIDNMGENVKLIISGSLLQIMDELLQEANPLFSRFSKVIKLQPLNYLEASEFFPEKSNYEKLEFYSVFGGSPYVLSLLDAETDIKENIMENIIKLSGGIRSYAEAVIEMEAGKVPHGIAILSLLKNGKRRYQEIEDVIEKDVKGVLSKELTKLQELGLITKTQPINKTGKSRCFYEILDSVIRFYLSYIFPNPTLLMSNPNSFYENFIAPSIKDFIARRFENSCKQYFSLLIQNGKRHDILDIGSYWYDDKINRKNGEFDIALKTIDGYELYDAKFITFPFSEKEAMKEWEQIKTLSIPIRKWGIISTAGFEKKEDSYMQITAEDMFNF